MGEMKEKQTSVKDYIEKWDLRPRARDELIKLIDQVRDEAIEECAKIAENPEHQQMNFASLTSTNIAYSIRKLKSKGEAK
jgi:hypothetical protein